MEKKHEDKLEIEIREHSDADFFPERCPSCGGKEITRKTYKMRTIQDLGTPTICRRIRYEKVTFICKDCDKTFTITHPLIPPRTSFMPGVIKYATLRILKEGDSIRRVTKDLNELHNVEVSISEVKLWVDKEGKRGELNVDFSNEKPPEDFSGFISIDGTFKAATTKKKRSQNGKKGKKKVNKKGILVANDRVTKKNLAGAIVKSENEDDTAFFVEKLIEWLGPIDYVTIDFSARLEAGVKQFFNEGQILKCAFHAPQLLNRGLLKELTRLKNEKYQDEIKELSFLGRLSLEFEAKKRNNKQRELKFADSKKAWQVYSRLRSIFSFKIPAKIETCLIQFMSELSLTHWKGANLLKEKCQTFLPARGLTEKGLETLKSRVYRAWRATIRSFRKELEELKSGFKDAKYLVLMNPINMDGFEKKALRKALVKFPWLRPIRRIVTKFYYQFRLSPAKRCSLTFLLGLVSENCHVWLKSAIDTLIRCEEQIFRFQVLIEKYPALKNIKAIKVVDESTMRKINKLYQTQFGMRTVENLEMRLKHYLECPFIIVPSVLEELKS